MHAAGTSTLAQKEQRVQGAGSPMIAPLAGCGTGCHRHPHTSGCNYRKAMRMSAHTNLVCMCCGHIQPVPRDQLPARCEHCRESFNAHGYFLQDDTTEAETASQGVLDSGTSLLQGVSQ